MKTSRSIVLLMLILSTLSCSLFLAPIGGRYNTADPKNDIPTITLQPTVDGYVDDSPSADFTATILWMNPSPSPVAVPVMRFDGGEFPKNVITAELHLWVTVAPSPSTDILAFAIVEDWTSTTITWSQVSSGTFFDTSKAAPVTVLNGFFDGYVILDVTDIYNIMIEAGNHGFYLETTDSAMNLQSSRGANPPRLVIRGYD